MLWSAFRGETDALILRTHFNFVEEIGFSQLHVFRYSPRRGTPAANYGDHVPPHVSAERSKVMIALGKQLGTNFRKRMLGKTMNVLVEDSREGTDRTSGRFYRELSAGANGCFRYSGKLYLCR